MPLTTYQQQMLSTRNFGLKSDQFNAVFGMIIEQILSARIPIYIINLEGFGLNKNALEILDYAFECNPYAAQHVQDMHLDVCDWFPFKMPSFATLKNLQALTITGERCIASFDPLNFPKLEEFILNQPGINIEKFPDLRSCQALRRLKVSCADVRYPEEFVIPGLLDAQDAALASMQKAFPRLVDFEFNLESGINWNRYIAREYKRLVIALL